EDVLVARLRLDLAAAADPRREGGDVGAGHRLGRRDRRPLALADQERRVRQRAELTGVVWVKVADADVLHLLGQDLELRELLDERDLRRARVGSRQVAGVP